MTIRVDVWRVDAAVRGSELRVLAGLDDHDARCTSVTHARGCSLLAAAPVRVGVDVEAVRRRRYADRIAARSMLDEELARWRASHDRDRALLQHWTRVEAYLKAIGVGVKGGLKSRPAPGWTIVDLPLGAAHVGALAVDAPRPVAIVWHRAHDE